MQNKINWNSIYLEYSPSLLGICRRYVQDEATAEDIVQDSFLAAIQKQKQLRDKITLFAWLKKIVVNNALMHLRNSNESLFVNTEYQEIPDNTSLMTPITEENNLILEYDFTTEEILWSIDQLPAHHRSVFNLYYIENNSHAQIADSLGINVNTSKSHLARAKKAIQKHLLSKTDGKTTSKLQKKRIQIMVFLGFGNMLWAQALRSKFKNFTIQPEKSFDLSDAGYFTTTGISRNFTPQSLFNRILTLLVFLSGILLFNNTNTQFRHTAPTSSEDLAQNLKIETPASEVRDVEMTSPIEIEKPAVSEEFKKVKRETPPKILIAAADPTEEITNPILVDSADIEKKPVVIVKKVVKRVKVYVEK